MGVQVGLVIGGGNFWRGVKNGNGKMQRSHADAMGMLATVMNAIAVADVLEQYGMDARVLTAVEIHKYAEYFTRDLANRYLNEGKVVIFAGGTGSPFFTTDTAAVLKALETSCEIVLKATKVDGVYSADPFKDPAAVRYERISFDEALQKNLRVMDAAAFSLCRDNGLHIGVLNFSDPEALEKLLMNDTRFGTIVS
jgi:uridylate kinase